ncbi:ATP-binding protein [Muricauda sp. JGD-17]|uniref:ATP-binding protein n=1 Tax=Flagellimonas ochracea TaxID=2696472 RepID=A0A964TAR0_9FLAO|nr:ATP-binding protein [Allomuricauda ochracea]NAY90603.1 ATP-binding protein [Allomuricauda ochracea]
MKELHKLESYDFETIKSFIENEIEESIHIEFKSAGALSKKDGQKKEVSKDVSAFANSDGGIIIYGIEEKNHKAHDFSFIDGNVFTKEWLEQIISSTVNRNIPDLKIFPIRNSGIISNTIYVVQIPSSLDAPHMARDKKYYKRFNFESVPMEEYEVRQLYGRKVKSKLILAQSLISKLEVDEESEEYEYSLEVDVYNEGEKMEDTYKVNIYFIDFSKGMRILENKNGTNKNMNYTRLENNRVKVSINGETPIYPNESLNTVRINFAFRKDEFYEIVESIKLEIRLYYPNGEDIMESDLGKTLKGFE